MKDNNKKNKIVVGVSIALILLLIAGATYAYFASQQDKSKSADINITADTTDTLVFKTGKELSLNATIENFADGSGNLSGSTSATAILRANSTTNQSETFRYYIYLLISENTFQYTTSDYTPELQLTLTGPNDRVYLNTDVTETKGLINVYWGYREISTTSILEEKWVATVTFKNLDSNQAANGGASFKAKLILSSEELTLSEYVKLAYEAAPNSSIYYHDENLPNGAGDLSYRYAGGNFDLTDKAISEGYLNVYDDETVPDAGVIYRSSDTSPNFILAYDSAKRQYTYINAVRKAIMDGYLKFSKLNNYVCFGSDLANCPDENLFRIIGIFDVDGEYKVKLISAFSASSNLLGVGSDYGSFSTTYYSYYYWNKANKSTAKTDTGYENVWSYSELNKTNLNTNFINYLNREDPKWVKTISYTDWTVGGATDFEITPSEMYQNEILNPDDTIAKTYNDRIGLMYVSDYVYGASPNYWDKPVYTSDTDNKANSYIGSRDYNWFNMGYSAEWTITRRNTVSNVMCVFNNSGFVRIGNTNTNFITARPVFYLNSDTLIYGGSGTYYDPYRIFEDLLYTEAPGDNSIPEAY